MKLSCICSTNERTKAILDGVVQPEGIELITASRWEVADFFLRQLKYHEFDISEMGLNLYWIAKMKSKFPYIAIPIFPQGPWFFHTRILVNTNSGIKSPQDLVGKRFGMQRYPNDLMIWIRGVLFHEYGIPQNEILWYQERPLNIGPYVFLGLQPPKEIREIPLHTNISNMMKTGELDACFPYPLGWKSSADRSVDEDLLGEPNVQRLFTDPIGESIQYKSKTGIHHINHVVVIREDIVAKYPWVAESIYSAFEESRKIGYRNSLVESSLASSTIWDYLISERARRAFGPNPFQNGFRANSKVIQTHSRYSLEQGLIDKEIKIEEMFAPNTLDL
jgi:4,5-dihydroxyphthalate decarboxylase